MSTVHQIFLKDKSDSIRPGQENKKAKPRDIEAVNIITEYNNPFRITTSISRIAKEWEYAWEWMEFKH